MKRPLLALLLTGAAAAPAAADTATFSFTGAEQQFVVPAGVTSVHVAAAGARGGAGAQGDAEGGAGATAGGDLAVRPGQILYVEGGGPGGDAGTAMGGAGGPGGFNGGAAGGSGLGSGY